MQEKHKLRVFISYSSRDSDFADHLARDLRGAGLDVWIARWELDVGDSIAQKIQDALKESDYFIVILSPDSVRSDWVRAELNTALMKRLSEKDISILPVLYRDCEVPELLKPLLYADFRDMSQYQTELNRLLVVFRREAIEVPAPQVSPQPGGVLMDTQITLQQLATIGPWLWHFIAPGAKGFVEGVGKGLGEGFAKPAWGLIEKARKIDPKRAAQVDQSPDMHKDIAIKLTLRVLNSSQADAQRLVRETRPALKRLLKNPIFFSDADIRDRIVPNLGYTAEELAGPNANTLALANKLVDQTLADGKLEALLDEIQTLKQQLFAQPTAG